MPPFSDYGLCFFIPPRLLFVISLKHVLFVNDYETENRVRFKANLRRKQRMLNEIGKLFLQELGILLCSCYKADVFQKTFLTWLSSFTDRSSLWGFTVFSLTIMFKKFSRKTDPTVCLCSGEIKFVESSNQFIDPRGKLQEIDVKICLNHSLCFSSKKALCLLFLNRLKEIYLVRTDISFLLETLQ